MDNSITAVLHECAHGSLTGTITFPEVVGKLMGVGVESYHTDLYRREHTYYLPDGDSHVEPLEVLPTPIAQEFSAQGVADAVRDSQQGKIKYREFLTRITAAGAVRYFVYLTGRCAVYIGRDGSEHVERFPQAP